MIYTIGDTFPLTELEWQNPRLAHGLQEGRAQASRTDAIPHSDIVWFFKKETLGQHRRRNMVNVPGGHTTCGKAFSPTPDYFGDPVDLLPCFLSGQAEPPRLRQQVVDTGRATVAANGQRQIPPLEAEQRRWHQVIGRRQPPALAPA